MDGQTIMIIMREPGTKKSTVVKAVTNIANETVHNSISVQCLGESETSDFVISGATCNSLRGLPIIVISMI